MRKVLEMDGGDSCTTMQMDAFQSHYRALGGLPDPISRRSERCCGQLPGSGLIFSSARDTSLSVARAEAYLVQQSFRAGSSQSSEKKSSWCLPHRGGCCDPCPTSVLLGDLWQTPGLYWAHYYLGGKWMELDEHLWDPNQFWLPNCSFHWIAKLSKTFLHWGLGHGANFPQK